jgi:glycosyltransferase involved in cell wall biosynthesis
MSGASQPAPILADGVAPRAPGRQVSPVRPARVALISNFCPHYRRPLYEELARRMEMDFFFFSEGGERYWNQRLPIEREGDFRRVPLRRVQVLGQPLLPGLAGRLTPARYDAVIVGLTGRLMVPFAYAVAAARKLPFVLWTGVWHHPETRFHQATQRVVDRVYRGSDAILVYGDHVRRALAAVPRLDDAKIFTAGQPVDASRFSLQAAPGRSRELVFVGLLAEHKGIRDLLRAFADVRVPGASLTIVGSGPLEPLVRAAAARDPRIELVGQLTQPQLGSRLAGARCLVLPSVTTATERETWGLVVNEAMHAGLPVVATDAVGAAAAGLVEDGVTGRVVPERDPAALAAALNDVLADDGGADRLGAAARQRADGITFEATAAVFEAAVAHARATREHHWGA